VCVLGVTLASGQTGPAAPAPKPQMAEEVFKNIPALKGIPVDEFMDTMGMFAAALSMNCIDCHTEDSSGKWENFAKETTIKQTARRMILMVNNLNRNKQGLVDLLDTTADHSKARVNFNGVDVSFSARLPRGGTVFGGWSGGKLVHVTCANLSDPNTFRNCDQSQLDIPYRHSFKLAGSFPLPLGLNVGTSMVSNSGSLLGSAVTDQSLPTTWVVPSNLFPGGRTQSVTVRLDVPGSQWLERWNQLDVNIQREFRVGRVQFEPGVDVYNVFNSNPVLTQNQNFGSALGQPQRVLQGRLMRLTTQINF